MGTVDFLLLLDASGSMDATDWQSQAQFSRDFVELLPYDQATGKLTQAQVAVVQFSSEAQTDSLLTDDRSTLRSLLNPSTYQQSTGGTSTAIGMMQAISVLMQGRAQAKKVIVLMTDGQPTGIESLPSEIETWCQNRGYSLNSREGYVVCLSKYAQSTTGPTTQD